LIQRVEGLIEILPENQILNECLILVGEMEQLNAFVIDQKRPLNEMERGEVSKMIGQLKLLFDQYMREVFSYGE
jgi:hypothetical protein